MRLLLLITTIRETRCLEWEMINAVHSLASTGIEAAGRSSALACLGRNVLAYVASPYVRWVAVNRSHRKHMKSEAGQTPAHAQTIKQTVKDPVCGMTVDPERAAGSFQYEGQTYFFCSASWDDSRGSCIKNHGKPRSCCGFPESKNSNSHHGCKTLYGSFSCFFSFLILLTLWHLVAVLTEPSEYCEVPE